MSTERVLPVFVQPHELHVSTSRTDSHRQLLTVLNPFEFTLVYKVLSNAPHKFKVHESTGFVKPKCFVDVLVRHLQVVETSDQDVIRVEIYRQGEPRPCGRKDIPVIISSSSNISRGSAEFHNFPAKSNTAVHNRPEQRVGAQQPFCHSSIAIAMCATCIVVIMLPSYDPTGSSSTSLVPQYLHPTQNLQLVAAYTLGLLTMFLMSRSNV